MKRPLQLLTLVLAVALVGGVVRAATISRRPAHAYLSDQRPVVFGHQGASGEAPSNTIESFTLALQEGADVLDLDVSLTKDGVVVVSHGTTIDRMSDGHGQIKDMTLAELRTYDFGHGFTADDGKTYPWRGKGVRIPTLEEVFQTFPGVRVNMEFKQVDPPMERQVWDLAVKYRMEDRLLVTAFPSQPLQRWRALAGERTAVAGDREDATWFVLSLLAHLDALYQPTVDAFQLPVENALGPFPIRLDTKALIDRAHADGMKIDYWTINDEDEMRHLLALGADGILTDYPARAVKVIKEMGFR